MRYNPLSVFKGIYVDMRQYGVKVAYNRYKFDNAKAKGNFDTKTLQYLHHSILEYLYKKYIFLIDKYNDSDLIKEGIEGSLTRKVIWCFWWQGFENAPEIVKVCIESIKRQNKRCNIILIDKSNYTRYIQLPDYIIEKVNNKSISYTHFSDILRFNLLKEYGGVWIDSTVLFVNPLQKEYLEASFFTAKSQERITECVANYKWTCYMMAGNANHILFNYIVDFYNFYFKDHDYVIHYFLTDYIIQLAYEKIPNIKAILDSIPFNNEMRGMLANHLGDSYTLNYSINNLKKKSDFYKLFWKQSCFDYTERGERTVWNYLKNNL